MIFRKSTLLTFILSAVTLLSSFGSRAQSGLLTLNVSDNMGETGTRVCLDVTAENFVNIESIQFNLSYNATLVIPECPASYVHPGLANNIFGAIFNCNAKDNGYLNFVWASDPTTIPDGEVIFTLCFNIIGHPGNKSPVYFNGLNLDVEICRLGQNGISECVNDLNSNVGTIMIISNTLEAFFSKCDADSANIPNGGSLTFYATGGTAPYSYAIAPGGYTGTLNTDGQRFTINNIPTGIYTLTVTDANGLVKTVNPISISDNTPMTIDSFGIISESCVGRKNGRITIKGVSGGSVPYRYEWSNFISGGSGFNMISGLSTGTYTVTVSDFSGCRLVNSFTLTLDTLRFDITIRDTASCLGARDGVLNIQTTGGTFYSNFNYQYQLNGTIWRNFNNPGSIPSVGAGINQIAVRDSLLCTVTKSVDMPFKKTVEIDILELKNISCFGKADGSVMLRAKPGVGYAYIPNPIINAGVLGGTFIATDLPKGTYSVTARDGAGCSAMIPFTITEPDPLILNPTIVQPECISAGSVALMPTGGTGAYTYNWDPASGNVNAITDLPGGRTYSVTVTDANQCSAVFSEYLFPQGSLNIISEIRNPISCSGKNDAVLYVDILSPNGPFSISWKNAAGQEVSISTLFPNVGPGTYSVQVTDKNGCSNIINNIIIADPAPLTLTTTIDPAPCFDNNGRAVVNVPGDPSGYSYEWRVKGLNNVIDSDNTLNAKAGTYLIKVISASGCEKEVEVTISEPQKIVFPIPETRNVTCFGTNTGQAAIINAPGGLNYTWSSGSSGFFTVDLPTGPGWVFATQGPCKSDTVFFNIGTFPVLELDDSKTITVNPVCYGDNSGSVTVEAKGGTGIGYTYTWVNGNSGPTLTNIPAGAYIVTISDSNNCVQTDTFYLSQPDKLEAFIDKVKTVELDCNNQNEGKIALTTTGGNPGKKTFSWQPGLTVVNDIAQNLSAGTYCATVSDNFGCKDTICYTLVAPSVLKGKLKTPQEPLCNGGTTCLAVDFITGGTGNKYTFQINNGIRYPIDSCVTVFAGRYFINLIDSAGCSIDTIITIGQPGPVSVDAGPDAEIQLGLPSPITNLIIGSSVGISNVSWSPESGTNCINTECTRVELSPTQTTTYVVTVTDSNGCTGTDAITISVKNLRNVYFPNIFTPNRDGNNDFFQVVTGPGVEKIVSFSIYDRWGNKVFEKTEYVPDPAGTDGWDGTYFGRRLDPGVFVYYARASFVDGKIIEYSGSVTLADKVRN